MMGARLAQYLKEHGWVLNLLFIVAGSYSMAGAGNAIVGRSIRAVPTAEEVGANTGSNERSFGNKRRRPAATQLSFIADRNLLGAAREDLLPKSTVETDASVVEGSEFNEHELKPCSLAAEVRATLVAEGAPEWSMAVIYDNSKREASVYTTNEGSNQVADDAVLVDVRKWAIVVRRRDHFELCSCEREAPARRSPLASRARPTKSGDSGGVTKVSETQYSVDRSEVDNALSNLSRVATQARIVPSFKNGKPNGFKLFSIKPGSIYSKIGLRNGDVIQKINGYEMNSPDKALELYQKLRDATSVSIDLQRRGQTKNFSYTIQ